VIKQSSDRIPLLQTAGFSLVFCILWFSMNYTQNRSLIYISQGSSTALSLLCGPFVVLLSSLVRKKCLSWNTIFAGIMVLVGSLLLYAGETNRSEGWLTQLPHLDKKCWGTILAVTSAFIYAIWNTLIELWLQDDCRMSMFLFFGFIGFFNLVFFWPLFFILNYLKDENLELPENSTLIYLILNACTNVLADYLWARSVLLTSPEIAATGVIWTVPMSFISDAFFYRRRIIPKMESVVGAVFMIIGFFLVTMNRRCGIKRETELRNTLISTTIQEE